MTYKFTDEMLKSAVIKADRYEIEALPNDDEIQHEFSHEFERKMNVLIRQSKKSKLIRRQIFWRRRVVILIAAIIILFASAMSIAAVRAEVFKFITEIYEKYTHIFFEGTQSNKANDERFTIYMPTYIPEGFKLSNSEKDGFILLEYEKGDDFISYNQQRIENVSMHINTEGVKLEELKLKGLPAKYYSNHGVQNLIWYDDTYMFMVSSTLDKDIIFKIAESVESVGGK